MSDRAESPPQIALLPAHDEPCALIGVFNAVGISLLLYAAGFAGWWFW